MTDDPFDNLMVFNERDNGHFASARRTDQWIHFIDLADHVSPAFGRHISRVIFNDGGMREMAGRMIHEMGQIAGKGLAALMFLE